MAMNFRLLRPLATGFNPRSIANLSLWLDASDASSVTVSTGVSVWADKSGNGNNVAQAVGNNQPAYSATINGKTAVTFDGSNDYLESTATFSSVEWSVFAVFRPASITGTQGIISFDPSGSGGSRGPQAIRLNGSSYQSVVFTAGGGVTESASVSGVIGTAVVLSALQSASQIELFVSNQTNGPATASQIANTNIARIGYTSGLSSSGSYPPNGFLNGDLGEVLFYSRALSATEKTKCIEYLSRKWGVA